MPDIQLRAFDRLAGLGRKDAAGEVVVFCFWAGVRDGMHDAGSHGQDGRVGAPERAQDCGCCGVGGGGLGFGQLVESGFVNEGFEAQNVTDELSFVPCRR